MKRIAHTATALLLVLMICISPRADEFDPPPIQSIGVHDGGFGDLVEADCRDCHGSTVDIHHSLYGSAIPDPTDAPNGNPGELYGCLSCHAPDTGSGGGPFVVERDCRVCHQNRDEQPPVNEPPVADPNGPYAGSPGQVVQFDGTGSSDPDGTIVAYIWDLGDGSVGAGPTPTHIYGAVGIYTVTLTVEDDDGVSSTATTTAEITEDQPPGNAWIVRVPSNTSPGEIEVQIEIEDFGGILWFDETFPGGQLAFGIGMKSGDIIFWFDNLGALFYGMVDQNAGTMMGIVFDFMGDRGHDTIFFADQQPP